MTTLLILSLACKKNQEGISPDDIKMVWVEPETVELVTTSEAASCLCCDDVAQIDVFIYVVSCLLLRLRCPKRAFGRELRARCAAITSSKLTT